jgi:pimeloyl-ACP methyl ester carboxylesterase
MEQGEVGGLRSAYHRAGSGPPLVLVHGFVGDGRSTWPAQLEDLCDEFTVVAWDAPGAGLSALPPSSFRIGTTPAAWRSSFGRSGSTNRTLAGAYAGWAGSLPADAVDERLRTCLKLADLPPDQFARAMLSSLFSESAPADAVARFAVTARAINPAGFRAMTCSSAEADLRDILATVDVPTLLLYGDRDARAPLDVAHPQAEIPGSRLIVLPGIGTSVR